MEVTPDQLRQVLKKVNQDLFQAQDRLEKHLQGHGDYWDLDYGADRDPKVVRDQDALELVATTLAGLSEFLKTCIAEEVVKLEFS